MTPSTNPSDPEYKWATQVGRFILAFGDIEHMAIVCLSAIPNKSVGRLSSSLPLGLRLNLLAALLEDKVEPEYSHLLQAVSEVEKFLKNRNLIAHNTVRTSFYRIDEENGVRMQQEIVSSRDSSRRITFDQLIDLSNQAEALAYAFSEAVMGVIDAFHWPHDVD